MNTERQTQRRDDRQKYIYRERERKGEKCFSGEPFVEEAQRQRPLSPRCGAECVKLVGVHESRSVLQYRNIISIK